MAIEIIIRKVRSSDYLNFRELRLRALRECPKAYGMAESDKADEPLEEWKSLCELSSKGEGVWYSVAEDQEGKLIGMLGALQSFGSYVNHQVEIIHAYVAPEYRNMKVFERLFIHLKKQLKQTKHLEAMIVWVTLHETQVANAIFQKFGFTNAGTLSKTVKYEGNYYDCCWLEAPL